LINSICNTALLMAYGNESLLVELNFVRDAAANLGLIDDMAQSPGAHSAFPSAASGFALEKLQASLKLPPGAMTASNSFPGVAAEDALAPKLDPLSRPKTNSSLVRRMSEKLGLTH
jgi:hypothetical protein